MSDTNGCRSGRLISLIGPTVLLVGLTSSASGAITGTDTFAITGTDAEAIIGTDAFAITGTDAEAITGTDSLAITGTDAEAITGTDAEAITGTDAQAITGTDAEAITGTDAFAITGTDLLVIGTVEVLDNGFASVLGQSVFGEAQMFAGIGAGMTVAIYGSIDADTGGIVNARIIPVANDTPSFLRGVVDEVNLATGRAVVSGIDVDYTSMLANDRAPKVGQLMSVSGRLYQGVGLLVAER